MIKSFALIPLTQGLFATIELEHLDTVNQHKWCADVRVRRDGTRFAYAVRRQKTSDGRFKKQYLHHFLMENIGTGCCDHINGDGLDNRMENIRSCSNAENVRNGRIKTGSSRFKGVARHGQCARWMARIMLNGKTKYLGLYAHEEDAAKAYDAAATKYFGEFARLNFPL